MEMKDCINYLLTCVQHQVFQQWSAKLAPYGVTPGQYGVLRCLWEQDTMNPKEMAQILGLETSTISGVLDRMQKKALIDRVVDPNDRRCVRVVITETGAALEEPITTMTGTLNADILQDLSPEDSAALIRILQQLAERGN